MIKVRELIVSAQYMKSSSSLLTHTDQWLCWSKELHLFRAFEAIYEELIKSTIMAPIKKGRHLNEADFT